MTVEDQWGSQAELKSCFTVHSDMGTIENGTLMSDWDQLM